MVAQTLETNVTSASIRWLDPPDRAIDSGGPETHPFTPFPADDAERPIAERFHRIAAADPARIAIDDGQIRLTYAQARDAMRRLAGMIHASLPGDAAVGALLPSVAWSPIALLACLAAGRPYIPLDLHYPVERNADTIGGAGLQALIVLSRRDLDGIGLPANVRVIEMAQGLLGPAADTAIAEPARSVDAPAVILYTSGSTGRPKGIVNSQRAILHRVLQHTNGCHVNADDHVLLLSSLCTIVGVRESLAALLNGATLHLIDPQRAGLREIRRVFREARITVCYSVPALLRSLIGLDDGMDAFASLRVVRTGGDQIRWSDIARMRRAFPAGCHIKIAYSSTETTGSHWFVPQASPADETAVPVGYMLPGVSYAIVDEAGQSVPFGTVGELVVRGRCVALGEWHQGRCVPGPMQPDPEDALSRIFHTGDLLSMRPDGFLRMAGRQDRQVKVRGQRVEPAELEAMLRRSPMVEDAAAVTRHAADDAAMVAFVVPRPGADTGLERALLTTIRAGLPAALHPVAIHRINCLPRLPSNKLDRRKLEEIDRERAARGAGADAVATPVHGPGPEVIRRAVRRVWRRVLGQRALLLDGSWADAGGDSLKLLQCVFDLEALLGCSLPLDIFDADMRPMEFAEAIEQATAAAYQSVADERPIVVIFPGMNGDEPRLAAFRGGLAAHLRFLTISYPGELAVIEPGFCFETVIEAALAQIAQLPATDRLRLAGYSFGGTVAYAAARRLHALGRDVAFLGLLDCDLTARPAEWVPGVRGVLRRVSHLPGSIQSNFRDRFSRAAANYLLAAWLRPVARLVVGPACRALLSGIRFDIGRWMCRVQRLRAAAQWLDIREPEALCCPAVLFRAAAVEGRRAPADLGWGRYCGALQVVEVQGSHVGMLEPPDRGTLQARFLEALTSDRRAAGRPSRLAKHTRR